MSPSCLSTEAVVEGLLTLGAREAALSYASRGWPVFPVHSVSSDGRCSCGAVDCQDAGKHPRTERGFKDATTDEAQINVWWSIWPNSNVGIATGSASGLVVIDIDAPHVPADLCRLLGTEVDDIPSARTGGGGLHLYFRHPGSRVASKVGVLDLPVDVRADGAYVIAPPSTHANGNGYEWIREGDPHELPVALAEALQGPTSADTSTSLAPSTETPVYEGNRNNTLASLAGSMRRAGFGLEAISAALVVENESRCQPPLGESEVRGIARSISSYPAGSQPGLDLTAVRKHLRGYSVDEVRQMAPERHDWKVEGYIAGGLITILTSKPKVGKTTLVCAGISAMTQGAEFLGRKTSPCPVVYLTEENPSTFCEVLARTGVVGCPSLTIVPRGEAYGLQWEEVIEDVQRLLDPLKRAVLVVDTLPDWVSRPFDWENNSGSVKEVMRPLKQIADEGHAVLCLFHQRKTGGGIQDSIRGSSAFAGDADILMNIEDRRGFANGRTINAVGRPTATPHKLLVEFDGCGFRVAGETDASKRDEAEREILGMLPDNEAEAMLLKDIEGRVSCSDKTVDRVLKDLMTAGVVNRKEARTSNNRRTTAYWRWQDG